MLAGPGTGKTLALTRRVLYLINVRGVAPSKILVLTFTRAAAFELRSRIAEAATSSTSAVNAPRISTLHAFALRQLIHNVDTTDRLPVPVRVADDWEERDIVENDLKYLLDYPADKVGDLFLALSNDWDTLKAENPNWASEFVDSRFLGAWHAHRQMYGYTLRSELVYQVKRSIEQSSNFVLESNFEHVLVDEYQDLNSCDLGLIKAIVSSGGQLFVAGDDDQSIYGFRHAHPEGIRNYEEEYFPSQSFSLNICMRCDRAIISLAKFIAELDFDRIHKSLEPRMEAGEGAVRILRFESYQQEAVGVAEICKQMISMDGWRPNEILVLLRNDRHGTYSGPIAEALRGVGIPVNEGIDDPFKDPSARKFYAVLHVLADAGDSLSIRTWLQLTRGIGDKAIAELNRLAAELDKRFSAIALAVRENPAMITNFGGRIKSALDELEELRQTGLALLDSCEGSATGEELLAAVAQLSDAVIEDKEIRDATMLHIRYSVANTECGKLSDLLRSLATTVNEIEPANSNEGVAIMTMHKAKGLTARGVIVAAAEDELIPGSADSNERRHDERRLLYVSLTRARSHLYVMYCDRRYGRQRHSGRNSGNSIRSLTRFLADGPIRPVPWKDVEDIRAWPDWVGVDAGH